MLMNTPTPFRAKPCAVRRLMHRRLLLLSLFVVACAVQCLAQAPDEYHKVEVYGGYSLARAKSNVESLSFLSTSARSRTFTNLCSAATGDILGTNAQKFFCTRRAFNGSA